MKKIVNVLFEADIVGQGIVNMDSGDQKWIHRNEQTYFLELLYGFISCFH